MITFDQLTELIKAGCTQDQIQLINRMMDGTEKPTTPAGAAINTDPSPDPAPDAKTDPKPEPAKTAPEPTPSPAPDPTPEKPTDAPAPSEESETVKMLKEMLGIMQKGALNTLQQNQPKTQTAEQILASVLNP